MRQDRSAIVASRMCDVCKNAKAKNFNTPHPPTHPYKTLRAVVKNLGFRGGENARFSPDRSHQRTNNDPSQYLFKHTVVSESWGLQNQATFLSCICTARLSPPKRGSPHVTTDPSSFASAKAEEKRLDQILWKRLELVVVQEAGV